jgi:hypothetical protein
VYRRGDFTPECRASPSPLSVHSVVTLQANSIRWRFRPRIETVKCGLHAGATRVILRMPVRVLIFFAIGAAAAALTAGLGASAQTPESRFSSTSSRLQNVLEGNWQSCQEMATGRYGERVYDHVVNGVGQFEVHLGPGREFAIFPSVQDAHRDHHSADNLLKPYRVVLQGTRATQRWEVASLNLAFTVTLGGGSRTDCESWFILLEPLKKTS